MIDLPAPTESLLINAAQLAGQSPLVFLDNLLREYLEDKFDIQQADQALQEEGEITLDDFRDKYGL